MKKCKLKLQSLPNNLKSLAFFLQSQRAKIEGYKSVVLEPQVADRFSSNTMMFLSFASRLTVNPFIINHILQGLGSIKI